jgi:hypothetical protein
MMSRKVVRRDGRDQDGFVRSNATRVKTSRITSAIGHANMTRSVTHVTRHFIMSAVLRAINDGIQRIYDDSFSWFDTGPYIVDWQVHTKVLRRENMI